MASGERLMPTSRAETMVVASIATHSKPRLSTSGTAMSVATNQSSRA